jgi:hypothetical protein
MKNHEIPFFFAKCIFEYHVTEITIKVDALNVRVAASMQPKISPTFLLQLADIPKYRRLLRLLDCVNFMAYDFHFKFHRASTPTPALGIRTNPTSASIRASPWKCSGTECRLLWRL